MERPIKRQSIMPILRPQSLWWRLECKKPTLFCNNKSKLSSKMARACRNESFKLPLCWQGISSQSTFPKSYSAITNWKEATVITHIRLHLICWCKAPISPHFWKFITAPCNYSELTCPYLVWIIYKMPSKWLCQRQLRHNSRPKTRTLLLETDQKWYANVTAGI